MDEEDLVVDVESAAEPTCLDASDPHVVPPLVQALEHLQLLILIEEAKEDAHGAETFL